MADEGTSTVMKRRRNIADDSLGSLEHDDASLLINSTKSVDETNAPDSLNETELFFTPCVERKLDTSMNSTLFDCKSFQSDQSDCQDNNETLSENYENSILKENSPSPLKVDDTVMSSFKIGTGNLAVADHLEAVNHKEGLQYIANVDNITNQENNRLAAQNAKGDISTENELTDTEDEEDLESDADLNSENEDDDAYLHVFSRGTRDPNPVLPETVTQLETPDGSKVYLVGTAHFSMESQEDVAKTIQATQPDVVMVELCKGRVNILQFDEKAILEEAKNMNMDKVRSAIRQNGFVQGVMYLLLLNMSAHLTKQLGMAPGGEFRRAFSEAKKIPGCLLHLGDRPIQITFQRALAALSWWQKLRLAWYMITCKEPISKEEVERCKQRDIIEELLAEMTGEFPVLNQVFVKERDVYLTHSLQLAVGSVTGSQALPGVATIPAVVVGVVGIGHVPGIIENWGKISENDIPQLLKIPEATLSGKILRYSLRASVLGLVAWGCYRTIPFHRFSKLLTNLSSFRPLHQAS